jgi:hypothetical protein
MDCNAPGLVSGNKNNITSLSRSSTTHIRSLCLAAAAAHNPVCAQQIGVTSQNQTPREQGNAGADDDASLLKRNRKQNNSNIFSSSCKNFASVRSSTAARRLYFFPPSNSSSSVKMANSSADRSKQQLVGKREQKSQPRK